MFLLFACAPDAPLPPPATPPSPSADTLQAALVLQADAAAVDASFAASFAQRETVVPGTMPCSLAVDGPVLWVSGPAPRAPGVLEAGELLHGMDPARFVLPAAPPPVPGTVVPDQPSPGTGPDDFARVKLRLDGVAIVYVETNAEPPSATTGRAFVWDGSARGFLCVAEVHATFGTAAGEAEAAVRAEVKAKAVAVGRG